MRRASLALASLTAVLLAACGGGQPQGGTTTGGAESGTMGGDTAMTPGAATMDTAMTTDTMVDTAP